MIEGNVTRSHEIRAAQRGNYSRDAAKRDLQQESLAHMQVQQWLQAQNPDLDTVYWVDFIRQLPPEFYQRVPESLWVVRDEQSEVVDKVVPGELHERLTGSARYAAIRKLCACT